MDIYEKYNTSRLQISRYHKLCDGDKMQTIKKVRAHVPGVGLAEAKEIVEYFIAFPLVNTTTELLDL